MFDLSNVQSQTREQLPNGKYVCNVTNAEMKDTKTGTGQYIAVEFTIAQGLYSKRKVWTNFNVKNDNAKAVEIGMQQLKALLENSNYANPNKLESVSALNGLTVGVATKNKEDRTEVSYFFKPSQTVEHSDQTSDSIF